MMFTGLIEETGTLEHRIPTGAGYQLRIKARKVLQGVKIGDSLSLNGICLTVIGVDNDSFSVEAVKETADESTLVHWRTGEVINLERALALGDRLGGHIVQGHVDGFGIIKTIETGSLEIIIEVSTSSELMKYIVHKGSICIDGISLTVADCKEVSFTVAVIPHTWSHTNLRTKKSGDMVNLETDVIARYVEKFLVGSKNNSGITESILRDAGF